MKLIFAAVLILGISSYQEKSPVDALLERPFDLQKFKKAKGGSNSGLADVKPYFFKPAGNGRFFYFFLYRSHRTYVFSDNGRKKIPVRSGSGFQLVTYKPDGKYKDDYLDPTESLIEITASYNDEDLPGLALIGLDTIMIQKKFGTAFIRKDGCFIYSNNTSGLVLKITGSAVSCLKYTRLNPGVTRGVLPKELTVMPCENVPLR